MSASRPPWDFGYTPAARGPSGDGDGPCDAIVATPVPVAPARIAAALGDCLPGARITTILARPPIAWIHVAADRPLASEALAGRLRSAGIPVRYVAPAARASAALGPPLDLSGLTGARPDRWAARPATVGPEPETPGRWFLRDEGGGVAVDRPRTGTGAGTRLAVIDDDALGGDELGLDAEVLVGLDEPPRHQGHGSLIVAWAAGAPGFRGVAPDASPRLYLIPKPGGGVVFLPAAIVHAALDGADVIVCATYVEGAQSPMLDDALAVASRLGRRGRGAAVLFPTGRDASSAKGSAHASFSLDLGQPPSDPRAFCVAPGGRGGGWFYWRDRRGRYRPFANRGPAVRWVAPGDDIAYPFASPERLFHAESSGASAIAAGVALLVLAANPRLHLCELAKVIDRTLSPIHPGEPALPGPLADPRDALPRGRDADGHDAKHGYGRLHAGRACLTAADPIAAALVALGEHGAAQAFADARRGVASGAAAALADLYSRRLARWAARALLADPVADHALRVLARHLRLVAGRPERAEAHLPGSITRQLAVLLRHLASASRPRPSPRVRAELDHLVGAVTGAGPDIDQAATEIARAIFTA